jgi:hypothetical protein
VREGWRRFGCLGVAWLSLGNGCGWAQRRPVSELAAADTTGALTDMAGRAGVIFVGHVVSIVRNDAAGFVDVRFGIDQPVSGCPATNEYGVREWAGFWVGQADRYKVGQRFLMMLHLPGASGMSAPVGGVDGAIPLVAAGAGPVMDAHGIVAADTGPGPLSGLAVDLRWVQARAMRTLGGQVAGTQTAGTQTAGAQKVSAAKSALDTTAVGGPVTAAGASIGDATQATLESVLAVLRGVGSASH